MGIWLLRFSKRKQLSVCTKKPTLQLFTCKFYARRTAARWAGMFLYFIFGGNTIDSLLGPKTTETVGTGFLSSCTDPTGIQQALPPCFGRRLCHQTPLWPPLTLLTGLPPMDQSFYAASPALPTPLPHPIIQPALLRQHLSLLLMMWMKKAGAVS